MSAASRDRCLHLLASSGLYTHTDGKGHRRVPFGCYKIGLIASGQERKFLTNDAVSDPHVHNHEWVREQGLVSFAGYQLRAPGSETMGVLALFAKHPISAEEDALLDGLSSAVAFVVQQAAAEEAIRQSKAESERANEALASSVHQLEERGRQSTVLSEMRELLQASASMADLPPAVRSGMERLLPDVEGALYLVSPSASTWNASAAGASSPTRAPTTSLPPTPAGPCGWGTSTWWRTSARGRCAHTSGSRRRADTSACR